MEPLHRIYEHYGLQLWLGLFVLVIVLGVWLMLLQRETRQLRKSYGALLVSSDGKDLGELLSMYVEQMRLAASKADQLTETSAEMERNSSTAYSGWGWCASTPSRARLGNRVSRWLSSMPRAAEWWSVVFKDVLTVGCMPSR